MPWDQVQESDISIHPAQLKSPVEQARDLTVERSVDEAKLDWTLRADVTDAETPLLDTTSSEANSFSVVRDSDARQLPDSPILPEDDCTAAERVKSRAQPR